MKQESDRLRGLYAITSQALCVDASRLEEAVAAAIRGGARLIQYRDKLSTPAQRIDRAQRLRRLCHDSDALFIVNDDPELAATVGADGVHLGRSDPAIAAARQRLGTRAIIGVSCSGEPDRALAAQDQGADYVAFGRFFDSNTKPDAPPASIDLLRQVRQQLRLPICAIGGLRPDNAAPLLAAGAQMLAAVEGVFGADDIERASARYAELFSTPLST